jgi:uncharacterized protein YdhG (YjbR/CyaY superfamily)
VRRRLASTVELSAQGKCAGGRLGIPLARMKQELRPGLPGAWSKPLLDCEAVSAAEIDEYLRGVDEPERVTLQALRAMILENVPEAEEGISYRVPAFRVHGKVVAGFAAFKDHLSYLPFSGSVLGELGDELRGYTMTKSSLHFPIDRPPPKALVKKLIAVRLDEIRHRPR